MSVERASAAVGAADALLIAAGAGMGVDSGLPDFRGGDGFWSAYPALAARGIAWTDLAQPAAFRHRARLAWGFYGHRLNLYRATRPHAGFALLHRWAQEKPLGAFVFTSNVDGQFQTAGFDPGRIVECHGSLHALQCATPCSETIWAVDRLSVTVDPETCEAVGALPQCPHCGGVARPNLLLFDDWDWLYAPYAAQEARLVAWEAAVERARARLAVIELGAGSAIPTVRRFSQRCQRLGASLVRINPREFGGAVGTIGIDSGALDALTQIDRLLRLQ